MVVCFQSFAWSSCSEWSVGQRVPFVVDVCSMTFEQLDLLLRQVSEGMDGSSDWPPPQEKECMVVATLNLLRLQVDDTLSAHVSLQMWHLFVMVITNNTNVCMSNEAVQSSSNLWSKPSSPKVKICWKSLDQILNNDLFWFDPHLLALNLSKTTFSLRSEDWLLSHLLHRKGVAYLYLRLSRSYLTAP